MRETVCVLLAVQNLVERTQLEGRLERAGCKVLLAEESAAALRLASEQRPSVIIVSDDFGGAGRDGALCRHLKADPATRASGLILLCGRDGELAPTDGRDGQPDEVLVRPLHLPEAVIRVAAVARLGRYAAEAIQGSKLDTLTGTFNHAYLVDRLRHEVLRAARYGRSLALVLVDIDGFVVLNQREGPTFGDLVLREVARALTSRLRGVDLVARTGPDDFAVVLPETSLLVARPVAERLRAAVAGLSANIAGDEQRRAPITASLGVAGLPHPDARDATDLLRCAREALGRARTAGGNRTRLYGSQLAD